MKKQSSNLNFALICHAFIIFKIASMPVLQTCSNNFHQATESHQKLQLFTLQLTLC